MRKYFNISNIINLYPLCLWVYMHMCVRGYMGGCMKTMAGAFILRCNGSPVFWERWRTSLKPPMAIFIHFTDFPHHPICLSAHNQSFCRSWHSSSRSKACRGRVHRCEPVCVCVCISKHMSSKFLSYQSESLWSGGVHCGFAPSTVSGFAKGNGVCF